MMHGQKNIKIFSLVYFSDQFVLRQTFERPSLTFPESVFDVR